MDPLDLRAEPSVHLWRGSLAQANVTLQVGASRSESNIAANLLGHTLTPRVPVTVQVVWSNPDGK